MNICTASTTTITTVATTPNTNKTTTKTYGQLTIEEAKNKFGITELGIRPDGKYFVFAKYLQ